MSLVAKETMERIPPLGEGIYEAVCSGLIDLGRQYSEQYDKYSDQIRLIWDVLGETVKYNDKESPRQVFSDLTVSLDEKSNLRKLLQSWRGKTFTPEELKGFDLHNVLGVGCQVQIIHKSNDNGTYGKVNTVIPLPKGKKAPQIATTVFDLNDDSTYAVFATLPHYLQERIAKAENFDDTGLVVSEKKTGTEAAAPATAPNGGFNPGEFEEITEEGDLPF